MEAKMIVEPLSSANLNQPRKFRKYERGHECKWKRNFTFEIIAEIT
jgi:hypothetical protein